MSYDGIRKLKTYQDENGKWNFSCETYDSSIWSWDNKRVWEKFDGLKNGFDTKEELEYYLFKNTLDGNFHGTGGKYGCIGWGSRKVKLSDKEMVILNELEKKKHDLMYGEESKRIESRLKQAGIPYKEWENDEEYKAHKELVSKACDEYSEFRYSTYFKRWKEYLKQQNQNRKGNTYVVRLDFTKNGQTYHGIYVSSCGSMKTSFSYYSYKAKLYKKSIDELKEMFCDNPNYSNIEFINVTSIVKGKGRRKYVEISSVDKELEIIKC